MIVLTAVSAAVYAAVLIPFKVAFPIVPGFTEIRPANVLPIICSLMFGPAAAWGAAIGNTIADFFGTLGLGTLFGFVGNFLYGYIPYKMWQSLSKGEPIVKSRRSTWVSAVIALIICLIIHLCYTQFMKTNPIGNIILYIIAMLLILFLPVFLVLRFLSARYFILILSASLACGVVIGWGVHILGLVPFPALGNIISLNNLIISLILGPILLPILYPVVKRMGLLYTDVMEESELSKARVWGSVLMIVAVVGGLIVGNWVGIGGYKLGVLAKGFGPVLGQAGLGLGLLPFIILIFVAAAVM